MTFVKICGVGTKEAALQAASSGAHMIGMIFAKSKRQIGSTQASEIVQAVNDWWQEGQSPPPSWSASQKSTLQIDHEKDWFDAWSSQFEAMFSSAVLPSGRRRPLFVGVFSNQPSSEINEIASKVGLDLIQLHGDEPLEAASEINLPVIRAIHISESDTKESILNRIIPGYYSIVLFDTKVSGVSQQGGSGVTFDWDLAANLREKIPLMVAGGLTPENVSGAIKTTRAWAVDVSSGVESNGEKDLQKIAAFVENSKM